MYAISILRQICRWCRLSKRHTCVSANDVLAQIWIRLKIIIANSWKMRKFWWSILCSMHKLIQKLINFFMRCLKALYNEFALLPYRHSAHSLHCDFFSHRNGGRDNENVSSCWCDWSLVKVISVSDPITATESGKRGNLSDSVNTDASTKLCLYI